MAKKVTKSDLSSLTVRSPRDIFNDILKQTSGASHVRELRYNIFYQIYAFKGVDAGIGTSTLVANTAIAIAEAGLTVCVVDPSILTPVQDVLLNTSEAVLGVDDGKKHLDWFDMPYTRESPLHVSKINKNISVLSFRGVGRTVIDALSTNDSTHIVELAFTELHNKFDIILIDACTELTTINTTCMQMAQQIIQVWNDDPKLLANLDTYITNMITLSCPLDKMRFVVLSNICRDVVGSVDEVVKQYKLKVLTRSYLSEEIYLQLRAGKTLFRLPSNNKSVIDYTNCIIDIVCHILNIRDDSDISGAITTEQILNGEVEGTLHKKLKDEAIEVAIDNNPMNADLSKYKEQEQEDEPDMLDVSNVLEEHLDEIEEAKEQEEKTERKKRRGFFK